MYLLPQEANTPPASPAAPADMVIRMTIALALVYASARLVGVDRRAIIYLDGLKRWTFKYSLAGMTVVTIACLYGLHRTANDVPA